MPVTLIVGAGRYMGELKTMREGIITEPSRTVRTHDFVQEIKQSSE